MIFLGGNSVVVPGVDARSWIDEPARVPRITKTSRRSAWIRSIFFHTTHGTVCKQVKPGKGLRSSAWAEAAYQESGPRPASFDCVVGQDGIALWQNDPVTGFTWHATQVNPFSVGIEMAQDADGTLYQATIDAAASLGAFLCEKLGIQKQTPWSALGNCPDRSRIERLDPGKGGADCVGVFGHRNVWAMSGGRLAAERGPGDPNDCIFSALVHQHGFEAMGFHETAGAEPEDLTVWRGRQTALGIEADGVPGPHTVTALREAGYKGGIWADGAPKLL